ncbi:hypothetical protein ADT32_10295 [Xylella fastidiosa]|nr:hypothetical protein ADT32_10295 [Xylella fastidiosa]KXB13593.1 hypothetical protein ADT33_08275 [Xylella fastidiosa]OJZ70832.1 hypothetical protein B375_0207385 [Xylella fastidiosa 6c]
MFLLKDAFATHPATHKPQSSLDIIEAMKQTRCIQPTHQDIQPGESVSIESLVSNTKHTAVEHHYIA